MNTSSPANTNNIKTTKEEGKTDLLGNNNKSIDPIGENRLHKIITEVTHMDKEGEEEEGEEEELEEKMNPGVNQKVKKYHSKRTLKRRFTA